MKVAHEIDLTASVAIPFLVIVSPRPTVGNASNNEHQDSRTNDKDEEQSEARLIDAKPMNAGRISHHDNFGRVGGERRLAASEM